jgi:hypothetical protein
MSTLDFRGAWQEQNEGTTLQIRNNEMNRKTLLIWMYSTLSCSVAS